MFALNDRVIIAYFLIFLYNNISHEL